MKMAYQTNVAISVLMDSHEDATACYELQIHHTQQPSCWDFTRKIEPKTATITNLNAWHIVV